MKKMSRCIIFLCVVFVCLTGCTQKGKNNSSNKGDTITNTQVTGSKLEYDVTFTGVLTGIDRERKICRFFDYSDGMSYELEFSGATSIRSKYNKEETSVYLEPGRIFDVYYISAEQKMVKMAENTDAFEYKQVENLEFINARNMIVMGSKKLNFDDNLQIFSGDEAITQIELCNQDELTVRGMGTQVYSIAVTKGHGYLSFINYDDFIGGYVSIGNTQIANVTEDMLLVSKVGTYNVSMENGELYGSKKVTVAQNERVVIDMAEFSIAPERIGKLKFSIFPSNANLYINDRWTNFSRDIKLNYGTHKILVQAKGYKSFRGVLNVNGNQTQQIEIILAAADSKDDANTGVNDGNDDDSDNSELIKIPDEFDDEDEEDGTDNGNDTDDGNRPNGGNDSDGGNHDTDGGNQDNDNGEDGSDDEKPGDDVNHGGEDSGRVDSAHTLTIKTPEGANVYLDGELLGTAPVSTKKVIGKHVITLYQSGKTTKSYEIDIEDDKEDVTLSFPALSSTFG